MLLINNQLLLAKTEVVYGTDPVPVAAANAILTGMVDSRLDVARLARNAIRKSISAPKTALGRKMVDFTIPVELKGSGTAGTAPEFAPLLKACGLLETVNAGVSVAYTPENDHDDMDSCTIYFYLDGRVRKAVGCMGELTLNAPAGEIPALVFNMRGRLSDEGDAALPADASFQTTEAVVVESAGFSFGTFHSAVIRSAALKSGNSISDRPDINSPEGVKGVFIGNRNPRLDASVEATLEATKAWFGNFEDRVEEAIDMTIGTTAGNIVTLTAAKFCIDEGLDPAQENGIVLFNLAGQVLETSGEDNFTLTFS